MSDANLHKEMDLLQSCINRMANNSFLIKGWAITITSLILTLSKGSCISFVTLLPIAAFCYLDAYFLRLERIYRTRYEWVIKNRSNNSNGIYDLNPNNFGLPQNDMSSMFSVMKSEALMPFYVVLFALTAVISILLLKV
ncbi:hypothetical protein [Moraxella marmotae]|uniref:hypothetical protein n=1 Tax=Moraxella marmotae TaxID=3344520 RepID=UPI0035F3B7B8